MTRRKKAREWIFLVEDKNVLANFTGSFDYQIKKTAKHLHETYGRQVEIIKVREVTRRKRND